jgi:hypothetical protein
MWVYSRFKLFSKFILVCDQSLLCVVTLICTLIMFYFIGPKSCFLRCEKWGEKETRIEINMKWNCIRRIKNSGRILQENGLKKLNRLL